MVEPLSWIELEGERVVLRPVAPADGRRAYELLAGREEILRWLLWDGPDSPAELEERYREWRRDDAEPARGAGAARSDYDLSVLDRATGELAGGISIRFRGHPGQGDLGYWIATEAWGRGFATEAVKLVSWLGFGPLAAGVLFAWVFVGNDASKRVLERNGYRLEHTAPGKVEKGGRRVDEWYFAATRLDWEAHAGAFEPRAVRLSPGLRAAGGPMRGGGAGGTGGATGAPR